ncbi:ImmA/IrrE family metallo-endopeptidase [Clostridium sp. SM-530-WT-3G]|uniref:ImmA/IrrE family metallo-endopeptidase n=1 Tax=Clostridium sp. SM-530-WT-3G TaxID=2725303 RepID=UPI00145DC60C|nr:ImmA/IrrE family metallo-endopeptidase [Clostridium sp. SM-530-WT-3G]NME83333.1 ImmA/IrrE family metallo-endopeptidase [Clostridium sp. SM-530-WT-3G]
MFEEYKFQKFFGNARDLAREVLKQVFDDKKPSFPIDPFLILDKFNVLYQFRDFEELEGIYIVPEDADDFAIVGINENRPITRQRFTAAHELCHHIKDRSEVSICPIDGRTKNDTEKFADDFASELLMPTKYLELEVNKYCVEGYISFETEILTNKICK